MKKVLLLSMPFGVLDRPAIGISLLKAGVEKLGILCNVRYLTFPFAEFIGYEDYQWITSELPYTAFVGDWTFTDALYGERPETEKQYIQEVLRDTWQLDEFAIERILHIRSLVPHFLDHCMAVVPWDEFEIVGFTSTFEQNIASLSLSKKIKAKHPEITIVFGGANWEGEMGRELHAQFEFVDFVCSGEADKSFPSLVHQILSSEAFDCPDSAICGIVYRSGDESIQSGHPDLIQNMDELPIPDFSDYFHDISQCTVATSVVPVLLAETSRGCWWGAKSHCTFCGLNGGTMAFRSKSAVRAIDELNFLVGRWQLDFVEIVDNILDMKYFNDMLPALADLGRSVSLFYEVKANLTREQVRILRDAGVRRIQPGIESMSDHVLKLMRKGTTALRNIQLLKWCKEYGIAVDWNILYGFPGETKEDYESMLELLPSIRFFDPPSACGPVRLDRFSPYFNEPAEFGIINIRPLAPYKYLYPFGDERLSRIAYYFDYGYQADIDPIGIASNVIDYVEDWQRNPELGTLSSDLQLDGTLVVLDTRFDSVKSKWVFSGPEKVAYEFCDELRSGAGVIRHLRREFPGINFTEMQVLDFLDSLVANKLMVKDGTHYLSLAISEGAMKGISDRERSLAVY